MVASNAVGKLRDLVESGLDPKKALLKELGGIENDVVMRCQVLVAIHPGTKYHAGTSIHRTDKDLQETYFQGTVALVVKMGPLAFVDAPGASFGGAEVKVGDWVLTRPADGLAMHINRVPCRLFEDVNILMKVEDPNIYW